MLTLGDHAGESLPTIHRALHVAEDSFLQCGEQTFFHNLLQQFDGIVEHRFGAFAADTSLAKLHFLADAPHVVEDVAGILDGFSVTCWNSSLNICV